jgi:hypothetical protein
MAVISGKQALLDGVYDAHVRSRSVTSDWRAASVKPHAKAARFSAALRAPAPARRKLRIPSGTEGATGLLTDSTVFFFNTRGQPNLTRATSRRLHTEFERLSQIWREATMMSSSTHEIGSHWAYQRIIGLGPDVVPFILAAVKNGDRHWGWALSALTGENPADGTHSQRDAAAAWMTWARERGYALPDGA